MKTSLKNIKHDKKNCGSENENVVHWSRFNELTWKVSDNLVTIFLSFYFAKQNKVYMYLSISLLLWKVSILTSIERFSPGKKSHLKDSKIFAHKKHLLSAFLLNFFLWIISILTKKAISVHHFDISEILSFKVVPYRKSQPGRL